MSYIVVDTTGTAYKGRGPLHKFVDAHTRAAIAAVSTGKPHQVLSSKTNQPIDFKPEMMWGTYPPSCPDPESIPCLRRRIRDGVRRKTRTQKVEYYRDSCTWRA